MKETIEQMMKRVCALPLDSDERKRAIEEMVETSIKDAMEKARETPDDPYKPYILRYYLDNSQKETPALYVTLEDLKYGAIDAIQGLRALGWRDGRMIKNCFLSLEHDQDIHKGHLLTEAEASFIAQSMGLSAVEAIKAKLINNFKCIHHYAPNIVTESPEKIIEQREEAQKDAEKRGFEISWLIQKKK